jgi:Ca2+-binding EF-hand superfamily protein
MTHNKIDCFSIVGFKSRLIFGFSILSMMAIGSTVHAQKFDLESYLKRIDVNGNGMLEESEMSDRTKGWIGKMGIDTDKTVSIKKLLSKVARDKRDQEKDKSSKSREEARKVPGFGVEDRETTAVARFGESSSSTSAKSTQTYSDSVMERVNSTLDRYDRNKDGFLDGGEIKDARWGSPSPEDSDGNKDGKLSRDELAKRYSDREGYYRNSSSTRSSSRSSSRNSSSRKEEEDKARRERERERFRTSGRSSASSSSSRSGSSSSRSSGSSPSSADAQAKYKKYAESLISNYDKDKDGKLNKDEIKQMRRPPVGADADKDGFITESELLDSLSGANKGSTSSSEKPESSTSKYSRRDSGGGSTRSSGSSSSSSSFDKLDANANRSVEMHEFSSDWDEKKIAEFYAKDKNGDGVITLEEWAGK